MGSTSASQRAEQRNSCEQSAQCRDNGECQLQKDSCVKPPEPETKK
jgi:hypothetical protein